MDRPAHTTIKTEPGVKSEDADDETLYEDAGDLDMLAGDTGVWLVKLPKWVMERWNEIDDDEEIQIGTVKVGQSEMGQKIRLTLSENPVNAGLPKEYDMNVTNMAVENTFIFTEKDMPGYEEKPQKDGPPIPTRLLYQARQAEQKRVSKDGKYVPYVRKAIPKRTALVGTVKHEATVLPIDNEDYFKLISTRQASALEPKFKTRRLDTAETVNPHATGTLGRSAAVGFEDWIRPAADKRKPQDAKAARMPKNELIDALFACFQEYPYWPIKGLREKLNQPEAYLKSTLEEIAVLKKSGKFALKWCLKPEYATRDPEEIAEAMEREGRMAAPTGEGAIEIEDEDDEVEMEDVI